MQVARRIRGRRRSKKSRMSVVRLDGIEDLVNYFKKHAAAEFRKMALTKESTTSEGLRAEKEKDSRRQVVDVGLTDVSSEDASAPDEEDDDEDFISHAVWTSGSTGAPFDGSVKSVPGAAEAPPSTTRCRSTAVSLYWVDFEGKEIHYVDVHPFHQGIVKTFQLHVWVVRDMRRLARRLHAARIRRPAPKARDGILHHPDVSNHLARARASGSLVILNVIDAIGLFPRVRAPRARQLRSTQRVEREYP